MSIKIVSSHRLSVFMTSIVLPLLLVLSSRSALTSAAEEDDDVGVPIFIWSNDRSISLPVAGHVFSREPDSRLDIASYIQSILPGPESVEEGKGEAVGGEEGVVRRGEGRVGEGRLGEERNIAFFLQDELSLIELSRTSDVFNVSSNGAAFKYLKAAMLSHESVFLPSAIFNEDLLMGVAKQRSPTNQERRGTDDVMGVANQLNSTNQERRGTYGVITFNDVADGDSLALQINNYLGQGPGGSEREGLGRGEDEVDGDGGGVSAVKLFIIRLADSASLELIDDILGQVTEALEKKDRPFTILYTAARSPLDPTIRKSSDLGGGVAGGAGVGVGGKGGRGRVGRKLQQYFPSYFTFVNLTNCVYFYAQNISISITGYQQSWTLPLDPIIDPESYCANYSAILSLNYNNIDPVLQYVNLMMHFGVTTGLNAGYWLMPNFTVSFSTYNATTSTWFNSSVIMFPFFITETPYSLSYSCYNLPPIVPLYAVNGGGNWTVNVTFIGLQVQAFNISNNEFGYYNDCVGFFTIMTWACLITLFVLIAILIFAACMFLGLQTPDRYDDVHGKTITVNELQ